MPEPTNQTQPTQTQPTQTSTTPGQQQPTPPQGTTNLAADAGATSANEDTRTDAEKLFNQQNGEEGKTDDKGGDDKGSDDPNAPITFDALQVPENFNKDDPLAKEFLDLANNRDLAPKDRAQSLVNLYEKAVTQFEEAGARLWLETNERWQTETVQELGGEAKVEATLAKVGSLLNNYDKDMVEAFKAANGDKAPPKEFGKELRQAFTLTGAGNHPAVVKFLSWIADQLGEGAPLGGSTPAGQPQSRAEKLFG